MEIFLSRRSDKILNLNLITKESKYAKPRTRISQHRL